MSQSQIPCQLITSGKKEPLTLLSPSETAVNLRCRVNRVELFCKNKTRNPTLRADLQTHSLPLFINFPPPAPFQTVVNPFLSQPAIVLENLGIRVRNCFLAVICDGHPRLLPRNLALTNCWDQNKLTLLRSRAPRCWISHCDAFPHKYSVSGTNMLGHIRHHHGAGCTAIGSVFQNYYKKREQLI
uniref:Uncharacterized protein n=1 Tax=Coccidioides posadasii RMSCC 3488 TaxID=454284 RepID=A0A0J6I8E4_COCPO|nr:hypothetical protein CPAG_04106 [Coccidioides posadasii RMSCC 3488]